MVSGFLSAGVVTIFIILFFYLLLGVMIGSYGRNTALGYWGSILVAIFTTPVTAFIVITILRVVGKR